MEWKVAPKVWQSGESQIVLAHAGRDFGLEDISGLPWIEIDFPEDVQRAEAVVLPKLIA
jgi:choline kinase